MDDIQDLHYLFQFDTGLSPLVFKDEYIKWLENRIITEHERY